MKQLMEYLFHTKIPVPAIEVAAFLVVLIISMLARTRRTGLMIAFIFGYRIGWIFFEASAQMSKYSFFYKIFGAFGAIIIIYMYSNEN